MVIHSTLFSKNRYHSFLKLGFVLFLFTIVSTRLAAQTTEVPALSFSPASLTFSAVENGTAENQTATLTASDHLTPSIDISVNNPVENKWVILPSNGAPGDLSFGINASGLLAGTYTATITAAASGYASATLEVTLVVSQKPDLSFNPSTLSYSVVQSGSAPPQSTTLSASNNGTPVADLSVSYTSGANWLVFPSTATPGSITFGINATGLAAGTYTATVTASSSGYTSATLNITLTVTVPKTLSFATTSLSYSVVQNGTTASKSSTLSASTGTPTVALAKSAAWVVLPSPALGALSFGIDATGLAPGTYTATVTASSSGYTSATLNITLTVTVPKTLSFATTSLSYSVVQNGTTASKSSTLSASTGTPTVALAKSAAWVVLPSPALGALSFGIDATGLAPGTYTATVTASSSGYTGATLNITLTVTVPKTLSFATTSLSYSVVQNGTTASKSSTLSASTGTPTVTLAKSAAWVVLPSPALGALSFGIDATGLAPGTYTATVTASSSGYTSATLNITLTVTVPKTLSFATTSLSYSVVQNGTTASKSSTLSASTGTPTVALAKSAAWVVLPSPALGALSFGINAAGLAAGTYTAIVTASSSGYTSATLNITLTVTVPKTLSFATTSLSYSVVQNGTTASKSSTLSASTGTPTVTLAKSATWVVLPSPALGALSFGINATGLAAGTYTATVTASSSGYTSATLNITLTVTVPKTLSFATTSLSYSVVQSSTTANKSSTLSASTGTPTITLAKSATWVVLPSPALGALTFGINATGLAAGTYTASVTAASSGYTSATLNITLTVTPRPSVVSVNPANTATNVSENTSISTNLLKLPNAGINNSTITTTAVYLTENVSGTLVPSKVNGTGGGDAITLVPSSALKLNTTYKFHITSGVKDLSGASFIPYSSTFTTKSTATPISSTIKFDKVSLPNATGMHSSLKIGPDNKLYALTIDGVIKRFTINSDGTLGTPQLIYSLQDASGTRTKRLAVGFAFDPSATATNLIVWITHSYYAFLNSPDWTGKLTKLSGSNLQTVQDVLINLPRSAKDHVTSSIAFGPDKALYFTQGSTSAMGRADQTWSNRSEHLLSATVLRLDVTKLGTLPLNVKTAEGGGTYNPYNLNAPLTIYASGVRNAYDLVWHSNGSLYAPTNGSAAGGNTPASVSGTLRPNGTTYSGPSVPALTNVQQTQKDFLFRIVKGGYYGHPNSYRGEYVMNGGNPTSGADKAEVTSYPVGTLPDANWRGYAFDFKNNVSPNGAIEYKSSVFNGALKGKLLVVRYSQHDDIITLTPGTTKDIVSSIEGTSIAGFSGFFDPLDLTEDTRNGNIYVSEYGGNKITLLKPHTGTTTIAAKPANVEENTSINVPNKQFPSCDDTTAFAEPTEKVASEFYDQTQKAKIIPNPVEKRFTVEFPASNKRDFTLRIIDPLGKTYPIGKKILEAGRSNLLLDISGFSLKPGVYFLEIKSNAKTEVIKLVKQ